MSYKHAEQFRNISRLAFELERKDKDTLRTILRMQVFDFPRGLLITMSRKRLVDTIVDQLVNSDALDEYQKYGEESRRLQKFVEGKIEANRV